MRRWNEVELTPLVLEAGDRRMAGVIAAPPVQWPTVSVGAGTPGLTSEALRGALPQIYELDHAALESSAPPGWQVVHNPESGELNIASPVNPGFSREAVPGLPPGWLDAAEHSGSVLLLVTDRLSAFHDGAEFHDGADLTQALGMLAEYGQLYGATVPFMSGVPTTSDDLDDVRHLNTHTVIVVHDPGGVLGTLADLAASGMMSPEEALIRAADINWAWVWEPDGDSNETAEDDPDSPVPQHARLAGTFRFESEEAIRLMRRDIPDKELASLVVPVDPFERDELLLDYWKARLLTQVADARGGPAAAPLTWLLSARRAIEAATVIVGASWDLNVFEDAVELSNRCIEFLRPGRAQGVHTLVDEALMAAAELRLALLGPPLLGGDQASAADNTCLEAELRYSAFTTPEDGGQTLGARVVTAVEEANKLLEEALRTAEGPLRARALGLRAGSGASLDGPYALAWDEIRALARQAQECQEIAEDPALALFLARLLQTPSADKFGELFSPPVQDAVAALGLPTVRSLISQGLAMADGLDDSPLRDRILRWVDALPPPASSPYFRQELATRVHCLPEDPTPCPRRTVRISSLERRLRSREARRWSERQRLAARTHAAAHALARDDLELAWRLVPSTDECQVLGPPAWLLRADILHQIGMVEAESPADWGAVTPHAEAALIYALLGLFALARASLTHAVDCVRTAPDTDRMVPALLGAAERVEQIRPGREEALGHAVRDFVHAAATRAFVANAPLAVHLALHRAAKGAEFAGAYGRRDPFTIPAAIVHQLARLRAAEMPHDQEAGQAAEATESYATSLDLLLPLTRELTSPGQTDDEVERNMRAGVDRLLNEFLAVRPYQEAPFDSDWDNFPARLDSKTVLVSWLAPAVEEAAGGLTVVALTREHADLAALMPDPPGEDPVTVPESGAGDAAHATTVHAVRQAVMDDPLFDDITPEGEALLGRLERLLPPEWLEQWSQEGVEHLCLWPHGPLHHLPFHLFRYGQDQRLLADDFTMTTINGLGATAPSAGAVPRPARTAVIAAAAGGTRYGLAREDVLEEHAAAVAATANTSAIVGSDATKRRLLEELAVADTIHIAAHGALDPTAPWFHCLYLSSDEDDDGRVFAHDLLTADLRGVRLVTLAACESALGRYDINDNLRGIPAGLLLAGAQSLIACLWPVRPEPATYFFAEVYRALREGNEPRAAFRAAQLATREAYPGYRDWGAFTFVRGTVEGPKEVA